MKTTIDTQTLLGFGSATGVPVIIHALISFVHPSIYTLTCKKEYVDGAASCFADLQLEAILLLIFTGAAVIYGIVTMRTRLFNNPTPPDGAVSAVIPVGSVPVITDKDGSSGLAAAKINTDAVQATLPIK
jgi:hypothetical protein